MAQRIITGDIRINSETIPFYFDGKTVTVRPTTAAPAIFFRNMGMPERFDAVCGHTDDGQYIVFFGVSYIKGNTRIQPKGWAISSGGVNPTPLETFDAISFTGYPIDAFFTPKRAICEDYSHISDDEKHEEMPKIVFLPRSKYVQDFDINIENESIGVRLCVLISYKRTRHEREIGTLTPQLVFKFSNPVAIDKLPKYYLYVADLMQFISFRQNIKFDNVTLYKKLNDADIRLVKIAKCEFYTRNYEYENNNSNLNSITFEDVDKSVGKLFEYIASRRLNGVVTDDMYTPLTDSDYKQVSYPSFLSCTLSFEGEYSRCYPDQKATTSPLFSQVKENIKSRLSLDAFDYSDLSSKNKKKVHSYHNKFDRAIEMVDSTLEEKFNHLCTEYEAIVSDFVKRAMKDIGVACAEKNNLGRALSEMRNSIGHGTPIPMTGIHVAAFRIARCFIYVLILDKADVPHEKIKGIIDKMF